MSKQEWFFVAIVVVVTLAGFGIIEQLRKIANSLDVIARTTDHWKAGQKP